MSFSEKTREQVRRRAAFQCCRCRNIGGVEAHHIIPEAQGGPDDFDNAAPLCPTCHTEFGGNPDKRKEIRQMRDWWYEVVEKKFGSSPDYKILEDIKSGLERVQEQQITLDNFKIMLKDYANIAIEQMTMGTIASGATGIAEASAAALNPSPSPPLNIASGAGPFQKIGYGGQGGNITIITEDLSGKGNITADGGKGSIGGNGGNISIQSKKNSFKGNVSVKGGASVEKNK